jgi:hypothetical protein
MARRQSGKTNAERYLARMSPPKSEVHDLKTARRILATSLKTLPVWLRRRKLTLTAANPSAT